MRPHGPQCMWWRAVQTFEREASLSKIASLRDMEASLIHLIVAHACKIMDPRSDLLYLVLFGDNATLRGKKDSTHDSKSKPEQCTSDCTMHRYDMTAFLQEHADCFCMVNKITGEVIDLVARSGTERALDQIKFPYHPYVSMSTTRWETKRSLGTGHWLLAANCNEGKLKVLNGKKTQYVLCWYAQLIAIAEKFQQTQGIYCWQMQERIDTDEDMLYGHFDAFSVCNRSQDDIMRQGFQMGHYDDEACCVTIDYQFLTKHPYSGVSFDETIPRSFKNNTSLPEQLVLAASSPDSCLLDLGEAIIVEIKLHVH